MSLKTKSIKKLFVYLIATLFAFYLLLGFIVLPMVAKALIPSKASELLGREIVLDKLALNPLSLSMKLEGLSIAEVDTSSHFVSLDTFVLDVSWRSLFRLAPVLDELSFDTLKVQVQRDTEGQFNFQDILDRFASSEEVEEKPSEETEFKLPLFYVDLVALRNSSINYIDDTVEHFESRVTPLDFELLNLSTELNDKSEAKLSMLIQEKGLLEWEGSLELATLQSQGSVRLKDLPVYHFQPFWNEYLAVDTKNFLLSFNFDYSFNALSDSEFLVWENANIRLNAIEFKDVEDTVLAINYLGFEDMSGNLQSQLIDIGFIRLNDAYVNLIRELDGSLNYEEFFQLPSSSATASDEVDDSSGSAWKWSIGGVDLLAINLAFLDESMKESFALSASLDFQLQSLDSGFMNPLVIDSSLLLGDDIGKISTHSELDLSNLDTNVFLQIDALNLDAFSSYVRYYSGLELESGVLNTLTEIEFSNQFQDIKINDNLTLEQFRIWDPRMEEDLLSFQSLKIVDLDISLPLDKFEVKSIELDALFAAFEIDEDGLAITPVMASDTSQSQQSVVVDVEPELDIERIEEDREDDLGLDFLIHNLELRQGHFVFLDKSIQPVAKLDLSEFELFAQNINSTPDEVTDLVLSTKLNKSGEISFEGELTPFASFPVVNCDLKLDSLHLVPFQGYSAKYIGRYLDSGSFSMETVVRTEGKDLDSQNRFELNSLELGQESSEAGLLNLPIGMVLMILKDSNGDIIREIPASGQTDDPDFRVRKVVWNELKNIFAKVLKSPFSMLASAVGSVVDSDEDISSVHFMPGSIILVEKEEAKLETMAKIFEERPGLHAQLQFYESEDVDREAFKELALQRLIDSYQTGILADEELVERAYRDICLSESVGSKGNQVQSEVSLPKEAIAAPEVKKTEGLFSNVTFRWSASRAGATRSLDEGKQNEELVKAEPLSISVNEMKSVLRDTINVSAEEIADLREQRFAKLLEIINEHSSFDVGTRLNLLNHDGIHSVNPTAHFLIEVD